MYECVSVCLFVCSQKRSQSFFLNNSHKFYLIVHLNADSSARLCYVSVTMSGRIFFPFVGFVGMLGQVFGANIVLHTLHIVLLHIFIFRFKAHTHTHFVAQMHTIARQKIGAHSR